jgi:hypothetical protein
VEVVVSEARVPIVCTLSPNLMPGRLTEFDELFARHLVGVERELRRLRLLFDGDGAVEAGVPDLFAREQQCCAFISLTYTRRDAHLVVDVGVPAEAGPMLDGLQAIAERSRPRAASGDQESG